MKSSIQILSAVALTAASMYLFDPSSGRRRRARLGDRLGSATLKAKRGLDAAGRDFTNRGRGLAAKTRLVFDDSPVTDDVLAERVRSALGRVVSHPGAIQVTVTQGRVELSGVILAREYSGLMRTLADVRGVGQIEDRLEVHQHAGRISALQGGRMREPARFELFQDNWSPAVRLLTGAAGLGLMALGLRGRSAGAALSGAAGGALLLRSTMNAPLTRLARTDTFQVRKTLRVNAPVNEVFEMFARYENFPYFMRNVRSVRAHPDGRSRWRVAGPAGTTIEWDAETTRYQPNELIAWRTTPHATVQHSGRIRFRPENGGTCVDIEMSYRPPAGALGHGLAMLFGVAPRKELDEDLLRLKTFIETGKRPHDSAALVHGTGAEKGVPLQVPPEPIHAEGALH